MYHPKEIEKESFLILPWFKSLKIYRIEEEPLHYNQMNKYFKSSALAPR